MAKARTIVVAIAFTGLFIFNLLFHSGSPLNLERWRHSSTGPPVTHIVLFQYKRFASPEDIAEVS